MGLIYNLLLLFAALLAAPVLIVFAVVSPRARAGLTERLRPLARVPARRDPGIWVHAASLGEVEAAGPLITELLNRGIPIVATTTTATGLARARQLFPGLLTRLVPFEIPGLASASVRRSRIAVLVLIETELWPALISGAARAGARVVVAGGRLSDRAFPRYRLSRWLLAPALRCLDRVGAQTPASAERFCALGVPRDRVTVVGDLKLDRPETPRASAELRRALGPGPFLVGGSTHPGEEEALLDAWARLAEQEAPRLRLVLAPRHVDRAGQVQIAVLRRRVSVGLRSEGSPETDVVILDTFGELSALYSLADLVFVGGTLAPVGGHNLLEPVAAGKVVVVGPHTENQRHQVDLLRPLAVLHRVPDAKGLEAALSRLWSAPNRHEPAERARETLASNRGALERSLGLVLSELRDATGVERIETEVD